MTNTPVPVPLVRPNRSFTCEDLAKEGESNKRGTLRRAQHSRILEATCAIFSTFPILRGLPGRWSPGQTIVRTSF